MSQIIREKNLQCLKTYYPEIAAYIEQDNEAETDITVDVQDIGEKKVLYAIFHERVLQLDSLYDSEMMLKLWRTGLEDKWELNSKMFLFGLGNGMYVRTLLQNTSCDHTIIVYEPSFAVLNKVLSEFDLSDIFADKRVVILFKSVMKKTIESYYYDLLTFTDIGNFQYANYLNYNLLFQTEYMEYMQAVQNACNGINSTQGVLDRFGKKYNINTFSNLRYFINGKSLDSLYRNIPRNLPAIIVAAGPSLDKNIKQLHKAKGKALMIAVDTALRPLLREGIVPDLCVSVDGNKNIHHFSEEASKDIPLVCMLLSHKNILEKHQAEKFFINDMNHHIQHFLSKNNLVLPVTSTGGSVANDAFSVARLLGIGTIILVGQDLAYTDNKTHSSSTVRGELGIDVNALANNKWVEGVDGKPVLSSGEFQLYRIWFEEQIINNPKLKVIDATEGGAKIKGSIVETLEQAIKKECNNQFDFSQALKKTKDFFDYNLKKDFLAYLLKLPEELTACSKLVDKGCSTYDRMLELIYQDKYRSSEFKKLSAQAGEIGKKLDKAPAMEYVQNEIQQQTTELLKVIGQTEADERRELISVCNSGKDYLALMGTAIKELLPLVTASLCEVKIENENSYVGNRILILKGKSAGDVLRLAADELKKGFEKAGEAVKIIDLNEINAGSGTDMLFNEIISNDNKAIIAMQAIMMETVYDGKSLLEYAQCPVFGWIFDHPVCHGMRLRVPNSSQIHIGCVDRKHQELIRNCYSNIANVHFLPHRGFSDSEPNIKWENREIDILFAGRYTDYRETMKELNGLDESLITLRDRLFQKMQRYVDKTYEQCLQESLMELKISDSPDYFEKVMNILYPVYRASYEKRRQECVEELLESGLTVTVCGQGWENFDRKYDKQLRVLNDKVYMVQDVVHLMKNSKFVLNIVPVFRAGAHERIFTAMLSGAICATDENEFLREILTEDEVLFYSFEELKKLPDKVKYLLKHPMLAEQITQRAYEQAKKKYTWSGAANEILQLLNL